MKINAPVIEIKIMRLPQELNNLDETSFPNVKDSPRLEPVVILNDIRSIGHLNNGVVIERLWDWFESTILRSTDVSVCFSLPFFCSFLFSVASSVCVPVRLLS